MPESIYLDKDVVIGNFRCNALRFTTEEKAKTVATEVNGIVEYEPPTKYYEPGGIGQCGQHGEGWIVRIRDSYIRCTSTRWTP